MFGVAHARLLCLVRAGTNSSSRGKPLLSRGTKQAESVQAREWSLCKHKEVPGAGGAHRCFVLSRAQAAGTRCQGHEHGRVFLFSVQAAGPNTGVFCVFCFPLARACTWRRVLVSGHEPGCVLSRVQAPGTNTAVFVFLGSVSSCARRRPGTNTLVSRRGVAFCLRVRARAELFFVRAATNTCACFRVRSCVPIPRGQHEHNMFVVLRACGRQAPGVKPP